MGARFKKRGAFALCATAGVLVATATAAAVDPSDYTRRSDSAFIPATGTKAVDVKCPRGKRVVPGGAFLHLAGEGPRTSLAIGANVGSSSISVGDRRWYANASNAAYDGLRLTAAVDCVPKHQVRGFRVKKREFRIAMNDTGGGTVHCPKHTRVFAGGALWHRPGEGPDPELNNASRTASSSPVASARGWYADGVNYGSSEDLDFRVTALCLAKRKAGDIHTFTKNIHIPGAQSGGGRVKCPRGRRVLTGGAFWHRAGQGADPSNGGAVVLSSSAPTANARAWYANAHSFYGFDDFRLKIVALCVPK